MSEPFGLEKPRGSFKLGKLAFAEIKTPLNNSPGQQAKHPKLNPR